MKTSYLSLKGGCLKFVILLSVLISGNVPIAIGCTSTVNPGATVSALTCEDITSQDDCCTITTVQRSKPLLNYDIDCQWVLGACHHLKINSSSSNTN